MNDKYFLLKSLKIGNLTFDDCINEENISEFINEVSSVIYKDEIINRDL